MITTWDHGRIATEIGNPMLKAGRALDIVEKGVIAVEDDPP
jgi:hypothetical protein